MTIDDLKDVRRQNCDEACRAYRATSSRAEYNQRQLGECGRSDPTRDRLAEYAAELDELERELTGEMIELEKQLVTVDAELAKLPENQEKVLRLRYLDGLCWERVSKKMNYCERYCRKLSTFS